MIKRETTLRVARPTDHLDEVLRFYTEGLGLTVLGSFEDHDGFDGVILGLAGAPYHLEFTRKRGHIAGRAPTEDNLLVFYLQKSIRGKQRSINCPRRATSQCPRITLTGMAWVALMKIRMATESCCKMPPGRYRWILIVDLICVDSRKFTTYTPTVPKK